MKDLQNNFSTSNIILYYLINIWNKNKLSMNLAFLKNQKNLKKEIKKITLTI